jgi:Pentapeptide repeats (8 copies)
VAEIPMIRSLIFAIDLAKSLPDMDFKKFLQFAKPVKAMVGVGGIFIGLWWFQQDNVNALGKKINLLEQKIGRMSSVDEQVKLEKDILVVEKDKTTLQNNVYTTLVQAAGGLILSWTAYVGYRNLKVAEDKQVTERFSKGIEHLGSDKIDIRLGGIYALEQIANDSSKYHWTIVEILSAFVREKCPIQNLATDSEVQTDPDNKALTASIEKVQADIQAAVTVMGKKKLEQDPDGKGIDLRRVNLSQVELQKAKLSGANLIGADLSGADLIRANLIRANLMGVNLMGVNLMGVDLRKCKNLTRDQIDLAYTNEKTQWPDYLDPPTKS